MANQYKYFAFISYKSEDEEWAIWLQHELEHYHLPALYNGRTDVRQNLRPIFRDIDELSAGNLPQQIHQALIDSQNLIVVCSPKSATSPWVNQEVETFIALGRTDYIFPFIVECNSPKEFFPQALLTLPSNQERLGGDVSKNGRDAAFVKIVSGMLNLGFDLLWNRYEREKAEQERKQREEKERLQIIQSRFVSEKAYDFVEKGDSYIARKALLELYGNSENDYPYTAEADKVIRRAAYENTMIMDLGRHYGRGEITSISQNKDGSSFAIATYDSILIYNSVNGNNLCIIKDVPCCAYTKIHFSWNNRLLIVTTMHSVRLYDLFDPKLLREWNDSDTSYGNRVSNARFLDGSEKILLATTKGKVVVLNVDDFAVEQQFQYDIDGIHVEKGIYYAENNYTAEVTERHLVADCCLTDFVLYNNTIIAAFNDGKLRIIRCGNGEVKSKNIRGNINSVHLSRNNNLVVASYNCVRIYNPKSLRLKQRWDMETNMRQEYIDSAFLEDNIVILLINSEKYAGSLIRFYLWEEGNFILSTGGDIKDVACITRISIDKNFTKLFYLTDAGKIRLWSPNFFTHKEIYKFNSMIYNIFPFNNEPVVAIETKDGLITIIDPHNGKTKSVIDTEKEDYIEKLNQLDLRHKPVPHIDNVMLDNIQFDMKSAIMTSNGYIIGPGNNGKTLIIESSGLSIVKELIYSDDYVECRFNEISPDEKYVITASRDGYIYIWELKSSLLIQTYYLPETITAISFSTNGSYILIGTETGLLCSLEWYSFNSLIDEQKAIFSKPYLSTEAKKMFYM